MSNDIIDIEHKRFFPPIKNDNKVCYLILHVSVPATINPPPSAEDLEGIKSARRAGRKLGIKIWPVRVNWKDSRGAFRYVFCFPRYRRDDQKAQNFSESFLYSLSFALVPCMPSDEVSSVFRIPIEILKNKSEVSLEQLVEIEEFRSFHDRTLNYPSKTLGIHFCTTSDRFDTAWKTTPLLLENERFRHAVRFIVTSEENICVSPGEVRDVLDNPDLTAQTGVDQSKFEIALHNAFKAIEAVIGDPPKNDSKFFSKIRSIGLDPFIKVGYREKRPIHEVIREMNKLRDKKAAHGSTIDKRITIGELMEYQECAHSVVWIAIQTKLGK